MRAVRIVRCIPVVAGGLGLLMMNVVAPAAALAQRSGGPSPARAGLVASAGNMHGFGLAYEARNADGSVTAAWRDKKVTVVYLGRPMPPCTSTPTPPSTCGSCGQTAVMARVMAAVALIPTAAIHSLVPAAVVGDLCSGRRGRAGH